MFFPLTLNSQAAVSNSTASTDIVRFVRTLLEVLDPVADSSFTFLKEGVKSKEGKEEGKTRKKPKGGMGIVKKESQSEVRAESGGEGKAMEREVRRK